MTQRAILLHCVATGAAGAGGLGLVLTVLPIGTIQKNPVPTVFLLTLLGAVVWGVHGYITEQQQYDAHLLFVGSAIAAGVVLLFGVLVYVMAEDFIASTVTVGGWLRLVTGLMLIAVFQPGTRIGWLLMGRAQAGDTHGN